MAIWKLSLIGIALLSIPWMVLKLVLFVCEKDQQQHEKEKTKNESIEQ